LYAPQELACDSSATMRVTAYLDGMLVGSAITNAQPGTWPSETLRFASLQGFNSVVVHYDKPPVTGGDWGPIFMADNMKITATIVLCGGVLRNGSFHLAFSGIPGSAPAVFSSPNPALPLASWTLLGQATETGPGQYEFVDAQTMNLQSRFYRVTLP
jgi:hypothetical protein